MLGFLDRISRWFYTRLFFLTSFCSAYRLPTKTLFGLAVGVFFFLVQGGLKPFAHWIPTAFAGDGAAQTSRCQVDFEDPNDITVLDHYLDQLTPCIRLRAWPAVFVTVLLLLAAVFFSIREKNRVTHKPVRNRSITLNLLSWLLMSAHLLTSIYQSFSLQFASDDYSALIRAKLSPWHLEHAGRWFSVSLLFWGGSFFDYSVIYFSLANLFAHGLSCWALYHFVRKMGFTPTVARLSVGLWFLAPGHTNLLIWASGFQQLLTPALILSALSILISRHNENKELGHKDTFYLCFLTALLVLVKMPLAALIPASSLLLSLIFRAQYPDRNQWKNGIFAYGVTAITFVSIALLSHPFDTQTGDIGKTSLASWSENTSTAYSFIHTPLLFLLAITLLSALTYFVQTLRVRTAPNASLSISIAKRVIRSLFTSRILAPLWALSILWLLPFLFNGAYFTDYHVRLGMIPLCIWSAIIISRFYPHNPRVQFVFATLLSIVLIGSQLHPPTTNAAATTQTNRYLQELKQATAHLQQPSILILSVECDSDANTDLSSRDLRALYQQTERGEGIQWATGWYQTRIVFNDKGTAVTQLGNVMQVGYCTGAPPKLTYLKTGSQ